MISFVSSTLFDNIMLNPVFSLFIYKFFLFVYSMLSKRLLLAFTCASTCLATYFIKFFTLTLEVALSRIRKSSLCFDSSENLFKSPFEIDFINSIAVSLIYKSLLYSDNSKNLFKSSLKKELIDLSIL